MSEAPTDVALVQRCLGGERDAFAQLVERYQRPLFNVAYRILGDADEARDVAQGAFLKAWEGLARFDPAFKFYSWIYRIAINEAINALKRRHPLESLDESAPSREMTDPEALHARGEQARQVQEALMLLKPEHRVAIVLRHFLDCSYAEMAAIADIPEKTVKSRLFTARRVLRDLLVQKGTV
jgi:RNA polymerase sigma-70 factor, ECF subfamily